MLDSVSNGRRLGLSLGNEDGAIVRSPLWYSLGETVELGSELGSMLVFGSSDALGTEVGNGDGENEGSLVMVV